MKDTFREVAVPSMVIKTPKDDLNSTVKITGNDRKIHKHSSEEQDYISCLDSTGHNIQVILSRILVTTAIYLNCGNNAKTYH